MRVSRKNTYHLILDGKYMYDNKFNQEQYNCIPSTLSIKSGVLLTLNDSCKWFNCSILYISIRNEGKDHILDNKKNKFWSACSE